MIKILNIHFIFEPFYQNLSTRKVSCGRVETGKIGLGHEERKGGGSVRVLGRGCGHVLDHWIMLLCPVQLAGWNTLP